MVDEQHSPQVPETTSSPIDIVGDEDAGRGPAQVKSQSERQGLALCLSGGGFRSAIFHLGALRRLNELGILSQVDAVSCVSGGSIIGAHFASALKKGLPIENGVYQEWTEFEHKLLSFVMTDIRTRSVIEQLKFWKGKGAGALKLAEFYEGLTGKLRLSDLPERPRFIFCATDLVYANSWVCERSRIGDFLAGYVKPPPDFWTLARAVAASSCFPPVFTPMRTDIPGDAYAKPRSMSAEDFHAARALRDSIRLTDGGVYDNLGLEPVWKKHRTILVSDGGKPLRREQVAPGTRLMRYTSVIQNQVNALRKRWLIDTFERARKRGADDDTFEGTCWGVMSSTAGYHGGKSPGFGYGTDLAQRVIANIRTDLDPFSPNEIAVLIKHGYEVAESAIQTYMPKLVSVQAPRTSNWPNDLCDERVVEQALLGSRKLRIFGFGGRHAENNLLQSTQPSIGVQPGLVPS